MADDAAARLQAANRVSVRAILTDDGDDVQAALAEAGIFAPVSIPVLVLDDPDEPPGFLGNGITPNVIGVLQADEIPDDQADIQSAAPGQITPKRQVAAARDSRTPTPRVSGIHAFAPVRRRRR